MKKIEVIYIAEDGSVFQHHLPFQAGETVESMASAAGLYDNYPACHKMRHGIFGKFVPLDTPVQAGDRIEVYRPLQIDPMKKRRLRAKMDQDKRA